MFWALASWDWGRGLGVDEAPSDFRCPDNSQRGTEDVMWRLGHGTADFWRKGQFPREDIWLVLVHDLFITSELCWWKCFIILTSIRWHMICSTHWTWLKTFLHNTRCRTCAFGFLGFPLPDLVQSPAPLYLTSVVSFWMRRSPTWRLAFLVKKLIRGLLSIVRSQKACAPLHPTK